MTTSTGIGGRLIVCRHFVRLATTTNGDLSTAYAIGQTVDGMVLADGDRILIKNQTNGVENGHYVVGPTLQRAPYYVENEGAHFMLLWVKEGDENGDTCWVCINEDSSDVIGINPLIFAKLGGAASDYDNTTYISDTRPSGTQGGASLANTWNTRVLNTIVNPNGISIASNQITIPAGCYLIKATAQAVNTGGHQLRLRNITDSTTDLLGNIDYGRYVCGATSILEGRLELTSPKVYELQSWTFLAVARLGLGTATGNGENEVFARMVIQRY